MSLIQASMTSIVMSLLDEEVLSWQTLNLKFSGDDELLGGSFVDVKEYIY